MGFRRCCAFASVVCLQLLVAQARAAPTNDNVANATPLTLGDACTQGTTLDATREPGEYLAINAGSGITPRTTWYRFTATRDSEVLSLFLRNATNCATAVAVYGPFSAGTGEASAGTRVLVQNFGLTDPGYHGLVTNLSAGMDYLVQVQGNSCTGSNDLFTLYCVGVAHPALNAAPAGAELLATFGTPRTRSIAAGYWNSGTSTGNNNLDGNAATTVTGASEPGDDVLHVVNNAAWFKVCHDGPGATTAGFTLGNIRNSMFPDASRQGLQAAVLSGTPAALTSLGTSPNRIATGGTWSSGTHALAAGSCVHLVVDGYAGDGPDFDITVTSGAVVKELQVLGNAQDIASGDVTPGTNDHTDFGAVAVGGGLLRTFTARNAGNAPLVVTGVTAGGDFAVGGITLPATVNGGESASFTVTFAPLAAGPRTATVSISSDDGDENPFTFAIQGSGDVPDAGVMFADAAVPDAAVPDAAVPDAAVPDAAVPDAAVPDAAVPDAAVTDAAVPDAAVPDAAAPDAAVPDAAAPDAAVPDAAVPDAAVPDAAVPDAAVPDAAITDASIFDAATPDAAVPDAAMTSPPGDGTNADAPAGGCSCSSATGLDGVLALGALALLRRSRRRAGRGAHASWT